MPVPNVWDFPHFSPDEMRCKHCGENRMNAGTMARLELLRSSYGAPMRVQSGFRCSVHNQRVSHTGPHGPHTTGQAVDILVTGSAALRLMQQALAAGFTGIGVSQKGDHGGRFLHLDDLPNGPGSPRPWVWSY